MPNDPVAYGPSGRDVIRAAVIHETGDNTCRWLGPVEVALGHNPLELLAVTANPVPQQSISLERDKRDDIAVRGLPTVGEDGCQAEPFARSELVRRGRKSFAPYGLCEWHLSFSK